MKFLLAVFLVSSTLFSNEAEIFFKESKDHFLLCRAGYETYVMISSANASIVTVNGTKYFRYKNEDYYFPLAGCRTVDDNKKVPEL